MLLFDKATRTWGTKGGAETVREWLFCDLLVVLLVLAFLHLRNVAKPEAYASSFWDILNVVLFFAAFWLIDRTASRSRFLVGYGYLVILPVLLLIWNAVQGVAAAASWWGSLWPFLILAGVFFVLEVITLVTSNRRRQTLPALQGGAVRGALRDPADHRGKIPCLSWRNGACYGGSGACRCRCGMLQLALNRAVTKEIYK